MLKDASGFSTWIATLLESAVSGLDPWLVVLVVTIFAAFFTEICSNTATVSVLDYYYYSVNFNIATSQGLSVDFAIVLADFYCLLFRTDSSLTTRSNFGETGGETMYPPIVSYAFCHALM